MSPHDPQILTSIDRNGDRVGLIPAEVRGYFRTRRNWVHGILIFIFLALPWTEWGGHQTIWLNVVDREFALFGVVFKAHDTPLLVYILGISALGLAFVTSIWGRVWCGWACPQTVFIDGVFRRIETWVEGNYLQRRRAQAEPLTLQNFFKKSLKWFLFVLLSSAIAHSFIAYFVGAKPLLEMIQHSPQENQTYFILILSVTAALVFNFGWFREQFCVIMCPYGRIQSVLLDRSSLAVVYDAARGEPRKGSAFEALKAAEQNQKKGDCVSCNRCVQVCPTGIDIRNGLQMECIACTACIDACDEIMTKVHKPTGLIAYKTLNAERLTILKPRSLFYILAIALLTLGLAYSLMSRESVHFTILRGQGLPYSYVEGADKTKLILNQFRLHIQNQGQQEGLYEINFQAQDLPPGATWTVAQNPLPLAPKEFRDWYFFLRLPLNSFDQQGQLKTRFTLRDQKSTLSIERELILIGPRPSEKIAP